MVTHDEDPDRRLGDGEGAEVGRTALPDAGRIAPWPPRGLVVAGVGVLLLVALLTIHVAWLAVEGLSALRERPASHEEATRFLDWVALGDGADPQHPEDPLTGYGHAYERLAGPVRERTAFDVFHEDFSRAADAHGPITGWDHLRAEGRLVIEHHFAVYRGVPGRHRREQVRTGLRLRMVHTPLGWRVGGYALAGPGAPEAAWPGEWK